MGKNMVVFDSGLMMLMYYVSASMMQGIETELYEKILAHKDVISADILHGVSSISIKAKGTIDSKCGVYEIIAKNKKISISEEKTLPYITSEELPSLDYFETMIMVEIQNIREARLKSNMYCKPTFSVDQIIKNILERDDSYFTTVWLNAFSQLIQKGVLGAGFTNQKINQSKTMCALSRVYIVDHELMWHICKIMGKPYNGCKVDK